MLPVRKAGGVMVQAALGSTEADFHNTIIAAALPAGMYMSESAELDLIVDHNFSTDESCTGFTVATVDQLALGEFTESYMPLNAGSVAIDAGE